MGSLQDAEDLCQETMLRAWRAFEKFDGRAPRAWLYRIATNVCLDALKQRPRKLTPVDYGPPGNPTDPLREPILEAVWMQPYPDAWIPETPAGPEAQVSLRQSVTLAFLTALQHLAPRQRAVLVLRDVVGWSASEVAEALGDSVASVNSALQRARETLEQPRGGESSMRVARTPEEESLLQRLVRAWEGGDVDGITALLRQEVVFHMPPFPDWYEGPDRIGRALRHKLLGGEARGRFRFVPSAANGQPTVAAYLRNPKTGVHEAFGLLVVTIEGDQITEVAMFNDVSIFDRFGLPATLAP
jgi:RNA polymerase sigma-70 factor (ECF subfamily)